MIPHGYKHTEFGIIPQEWEVKRICDIGIVVTGSTPPTKDESNYGSDYMFVTPADISDEKYITDTERKLSNKGLSISRRMPEGSILFTCIGIIGKIAIASKELTSNQQINAVICNDIYNEYLYYELLSRKGNIKSLAGEQVLPMIKKSDFEKIKIPVPPVEEQRKIAEILGVWDKAIELQARRVDKLELRKRALMQRLLTGRLRLPGFSDPWQKVPINSFAKEISIKNKKNEPLVVLSCTKYNGLVSSLEYFGKQIYSNDLRTYKIVPYNHFAYATNHIEEGSIGYQNIMDRALISPMYTVFCTDTKIVNDTFLFMLLKTHHLIYLYCSRMEGSIDRRGGLRWESFSSIKINIPSLAEQTAIADVLSTADKEIEIAKAKLTAYRTQKRGLMQQLLTGKKRVK